MRSKWIVALVAAAFLFPEVSRAETVRHIRGDALVGVDSLGRVLIAVDQQPADGFVDFFFLFTAPGRYAGPWSERIKKAEIVAGERGLVLRSTPPFFVVSLAIGPEDVQSPKHPPFAEVFEAHEGVELITVPDGSRTFALASVDINDLWTWPEFFAYDLLNPASCTNDFDCQSGGSSSPSCGIFGCPQPPTGCSISCNYPTTFACCKCTQAGDAMCRCRGCLQPREPWPPQK